ncbi:MAG: CE1759 family FMN reductase [Propionicimonas sp.]|nr:NAD(P)H-dependent oxidoreductase [Propionicimonas sp.]
MSGTGRIAVISAGLSDPSSTRLLADRLTQAAIGRLGEVGITATATVIDLGPLAVDIARALVAGFPGDRIQHAIDALATADAVIAATPVYKAGISGLFKSFVDLLDNDLLIAKPVVLAATAGSSRHAMVADDHLRPLFAFFRALPAPTGVFAAPEDWNTPDLARRIDRAASELAQLVATGAGRAIAGVAWGGYQHQFGGNAPGAEHTTADVDFTTDLMRIATGGSSLRPRPDA